MKITIVEGKSKEAELVLKEGSWAAAAYHSFVRLCNNISLDRALGNSPMELPVVTEGSHAVVEGLRETGHVPTLTRGKPDPRFSPIDVSP